MTTINGHPYGEALQGGADNDVIRGLGGDDALLGFGGDDVLDGGDGDDSLFGGDGQDYLIGGRGSDLVGYNETAALTIDLRLQNRPQDTGGGGIEWLSSVEGVSGGSGGDTLTGNNRSNALVGNEGDDLLLGLGGGDILTPTLDFGGAVPGDDTADGGAGRDAVEINAGGLPVTASLLIQGAPQATGVGTVTLIDIEMLFSGDGTDTLTGDAGNNILGGGWGGDVLQGGDGPDVLWGAGGVRGQTLLVEDSPQFDGDDTLVGGDGADTVVGSLGSDRLVGGKAADWFVFVDTDVGAANAGEVDVIADLEAKDWIDLSQIDANAGAAGNQAFVLVAALDGTVGQAALWFDGSDTWLELNVDADLDPEGLIRIPGDHHDHANLVL